MDITRQSLTFKLRKTLRYMRLYGPQRTYIKVRSEWHMKRKVSTVPSSAPWSARQTVGLIGCGRYGFSTIAYYLKKRFGPVIGACMDIDLQRAASLSQFHHIPFFTDQADQIINDPRIRMVYIASNHATHAEYAIAALEAGKDVYIEKPHVVTEDQLTRLIAAYRSSDKKIFLGFNRPVSHLGKIALDHLNQQPGAGVFNWFVAGMVLDPGHWYLDAGEGGRVLGNICHWTDYLMHLIPQNTFPITIHPTRHGRPDEDIAVAFHFGDGSIGVITYSAKGYPFEGVRERFSGQKGDCLAALDDFERLRLDELDRRRVYRNFYRHHGHRENICGAYANVYQNEPYDRQAHLARIANTAWLFLKTKEALEANQPLTINAYDLGD